MVFSSAAGVALGAKDVALDQLTHPGPADRPLTEDGVVEGANVEARAEPTFGLLAQFEDLQLADLVGQRLPRPADVPIDLVFDVVLGHEGVVEHVLDRARPAPAFGV